MLLVLWLLAGCAANTANDPLISFAVPEAQREGYQTLARQFFDETGLRVRVITFEEIARDAGIDSLPDALRVAMTADTFVVQSDLDLVQRGVLRDLTRFISADTDFALDDFYPAALARVRSGEGIWALPASIDFEMIAYDAAAFDQIGLAHPALDWTWDDFLSTARALTQRDGEQVTRWGFVQQDYDPIPFVAARLDQPQVAEALREYAALFGAEAAAPRPDQLTRGDAQRLIEEGRAAMWSTLASNAPDALAPYPRDIAPIVVRAHAISEGTRRPEESWRWVAYLARHMLPDSNELPARMSLAEANGFWQTSHEALYRFALDHASTSMPRASVDQAWRTALLAVLDGAQVEQALADAQTFIEERAAQMLRVEAFNVPRPQAGAERGVSITFLHPTVLAETSPYAQLAEAFNASHPDITVQAQVFGVAEPTLEQVARVADCFVWNSLDDYPGNAAAILNLQTLIANDGSFPLDDFYPNTLDVFREADALWALPAEVRLPVIFYRSELFDAAGIATPRAGWTPDDFLDAAIKLTHDDQYGFISLSLYGAYDLNIFMAASAALLFDDSMNPPAPRFDAASTIAAARWYVELSTVHGLDRVSAAEDPARVDTIDWNTRGSLVNRGRVAMWTDLLHGPNALAPFPLNEGGKLLAFFDGYYISASSLYPQQCYAWLRYLSDHAAQVAREASARRSTFDAPEYIERIGAQAVDTLRFEIEYAVTLDFFVGRDEWRQPALTWFERAVFKALREEQDIAPALEEAQMLAESYVDCLSEQDGFEQRSMQGQCALEVDPNYVVDQ